MTTTQMILTVIIGLGLLNIVAVFHAVFIYRAHKQVKKDYRDRLIELLAK